MYIGRCQGPGDVVEREMGTSCLMGTELQFRKVKNSGKWYTIVNMLSAAELYCQI